jgi:CRP-like cAMP-binding protein
MSTRASSPRRPTDRRPKNQLLRELPEAEFLRLLPNLTTIATRSKHVFHRRGDAVEYVYFPNGGVASVTAALADGSMVETATVGREGMLGIEAYFGNDPVAAGGTMMQVAESDTDAERLSVVAFRRELALQGALFTAVGRYAQSALRNIMQSTACNARHHIHERCCRWLLLTHDRIGRDQFRLSQEFLAVMLGVRRQSVTGVAGALQSTGLISYKYGEMTILNRKGLEDAACECYALVQAGSGVAHT